MKLVDALVETLRDWNLRYVFGVSGANIEHLHDAIHRLGGGVLSSVLAKSEVGAAFMADCRARVHRTLGVCCATSGGGMMNLAVGIAEARAESVPVLAIVGQVPSALEGRGGFQDSSGPAAGVDALALFQSISKYAARISPGVFWAELAAAVRAALGGRPGPAVLLVPRDMYDAEVGPRPSWLPRSLAECSGAAVGWGDDGALLATLRGARSPVLVLGTGMGRSAAPEAGGEFASLARIPVMTTMGDPGAFPHDHPLYFGTVGVAGHPSAHAYLNERADLVIAAGTGLNILTRQAIAPALTRAKWVVVNVDPAQAARTIKPHLVISADAGAVFKGLIEQWRSSPFEFAPVRDYALTRYCPTLEPPLEDDGRATPSSLLQSQALDMLDLYVPDRGHVLYDAGNCAAAALHVLTIPKGTSTTIALGMGGMGYAIPAAIGAQLGAPGRRSMVLAGDGAFLMLGFEIHTAVELGLPILFVVFNNRKHGMCIKRQRLFFEGRLECASYAHLDVALSARGFGPPERLWVGCAGTEAELARALADYASVGRDRPGVLELKLAREEVPPFTPFLPENAPTYVVRRADPFAEMPLAA